MSVMYVIVPVALLLVLAAVLANLWAARQGQFDDLTTPAMRVLHDEPELTATLLPSPDEAEPPHDVK